MSEQNNRSDPVDKYYKPAQCAEAVSTALFIVAGILSFVVLFVDKASSPVLYQVVEIAFALAVIALFSLGMALRLYLSPRAEDQRRLGFISNSYGTPLTHEKTVGFYNNPETEPTKRLGLSLMENCFFSRSIALEMLKRERIIVAAYVFVFLIATLIRNVDLAIVPIAAQAVFSEQIISRWLRLEWLRFRCDSIYTKLYELFQSLPLATIRDARIIDALTAYETSKANAGIGLSSRIFYKLNSSLSAEWDRVLLTLQLKTTPTQP